MTEREEQRKRSKYSCWTDDPTKIRGGPQEYQHQVGWYDMGSIRIPLMQITKTNWLPIKCGKLSQVGLVDAECAGCALDKENCNEQG